MSISRIARVNGLVLTISVVLQLYDDIKQIYGFKYLLTNRLNQDCIDNLLSVIKAFGGHRDNPTPNEFISAIKQVIYNKLMIPLGSNTNCETDGDTCLALQFPISTTNTVLNKCNSEHLDVKIIDDVQENVMTYVAGCICKKVLANHGRKICKTALVKIFPNLDNPAELITHFKAYCTQHSDCDCAN